MASCDQTCQFLIDIIKEEDEKSSPTKQSDSNKKEVEEPKTQEIKDEDNTDAQSPEKKKKEASEPQENAKEDLEPQKWWKFVIKASYLKATILAQNMEFVKPMNLIVKFAEPNLKRLLSHFCKEISAAEDKVSSDIVDDDSA